MIEKRVEQKYLVNEFNLDKFLYQHKKDLKNLFSERKLLAGTSTPMILNYLMILLRKQRLSILKPWSQWLQENAQKNF